MNKGRITKEAVLQAIKEGLEDGTLGSDPIRMINSGYFMFKDGYTATNPKLALARVLEIMDKEHLGTSPQHDDTTPGTPA